MDIDRNNFKQHYQKIISLIQSSDFISFDCEFSGISTDHFQKIQKYDSDEDIYQKMKHTVQNYHLLQIGLSIFTFCQVEKKYIAYPFNIYLNPNYSTQSESIKKQMLQLECYNFMAANGLDFSKIYSSGLSYIKLAEKEKVIENMKPKQHYGVGLSLKNREYLEGILKQVEEYEANPNPNAKECVIECHSTYLCQKILKRQVANHIHQSKNITIDKGTTETTIILRKKKQFTNYSGSKYNNHHNNSHNKNHNQIDEEGIIQQEEEIKQNTTGTTDDETESSLRSDSEIDLLGFTLIVEAIIKAKRPIIGHYMGLDLFYFYDHFVNTLPDNFLQFVHNLNECFPYVIDTKVLAKKLQSKIKRLPLHLEGLYKAVAKDDKCLKSYHNTILSKDPEYSKYNSDGQMHEAGFDSYITGVAFIGMCYYEKCEYEKERQLKDVPQRTKKGKIIQEYQDKQDQIIKDVMTNYLDPKFPSDNLNLIYLRSGGTFYFNNEFQRARDSFDINHNKEYLANTFFIKFNPALNFDEIALHFSQYGDVEIKYCDNGAAFIEYEQFDLFEGIEDKLEHVLPLLKNDKFEIFRYVERKRFTAYSYFN